ncbi:hypothetical protein Vretimale_112 [Volvox reticuliferus]|uniref:carotenoid 9,10-dioxygenase n=1 Tax=Volvox reticuliferus TaxID=1737510 RepID=A0A8J4D712_9CHLO|nr:hypothetical protein Vretifemale_8296 [Volvox reticuliferus]GIL93883.1 hypothetical protein Vretimale_112 [Volvox reticuliferus]
MGSNTFAQRSAPQWLLYAVPAACLSASYLIYSNRRTLYAWAYQLIAKVPKPAGKAYLSGNFAPVSDELLEELEIVEGKVPEGLNGCYVRTGPNPFFKPVAGYHWFDGDGMLHLVRLRDGKASYCNRFVETERLQQERQAGRPLFVRLGDMFGLRGLALILLVRLGRAVGVLDNSKGLGTANTALVYHAGRLLTLNEGDLPYGVRITCNGVVETMGRLLMQETWGNNFTAHPKLDPQNGELLFIGYKLDSKPYLSAGIMDVYGNLVRQWNIDIHRPVMMHDMAATEQYLVILDLPLCFDPEAMIKEKSLPFKLRNELPSRIGLLRRDHPSCPTGFADVQWFTLPGPSFMAFHVAASWEEPNGDVKVFACQMNELDLSLHHLTRAEYGLLTEYTLSPSTGVAKLRQMTKVPGDFPVINPSKATRKCKWCWMATPDHNASPLAFLGIAKMDLEAAPGTDACVAMINYPPGMFGGEAVFVPRAGTTVEDDGYLVVYVYDTKADTSYMNIYCARTMSSTPIASLRMPRRVPYGFHGTWVTEEQIKKQVMWV